MGTLSRNYRFPRTGYLKRHLGHLMAGLLLALSLTTVQAEELQTEIIASHRASELVSILAPMATPEGSVSAYQDQLIIRATPARLQLIRDTLATLDRPLKNLRISARYQQTSSSQSQGTGINGNVIIQNGRVGGSARLHAEDRDERRQDNSQYSITALEGSSVQISTGQDVPYLSVIRQNARQPVIGREYIPVQSGMFVTPQLQADGNVALEISFQQTDSGRSGIINRDATISRVLLTPGQWTSLSSINQNLDQQGSNIGQRYRQQQQSQSPLEIRIDVLP